MMAKAKLNVEIDIVTADRIVVETLKEDYLRVKENIQNIKNLIKTDDVKSYVLEDLEYDKKLLKGIKRVLAYYMTHDECQKFIEENK
jgi:hypothetical protein